jgi:hypothetical protein
MTKVFVLGAGFSKAVSTEMPVMDELSRHVRSELDAKNERPIPGVGTPLAENFEQWLSYLIEAPPWLTEAERALNRWGFITLTDTVYDVLCKLQLRALQSPCPDWLQALVRYWQNNSCTVITFNYDLVVEIAHAVFTNHALAPMYSVPITFMNARDNMVFGREKTDEGLRLLKMHGSLNWRYSGPGGPPGDIVYEVGYESTGHSAVSIHRAGKWDVQAVSGSIDDGSPAESDRVPMIVPPTTAKSPYYVNQTLQLVWRQAAHALRNAEELVLMGFGLPPTDQLVASLLATNFPLSESSIITPVDYSEEIVRRVRSVFTLEKDDDRVITKFAGLEENAIPEWVTQFVTGVT